MAIQWISGDTFTCVSGDTKPTLVPTDTKAIETNTDDVYRFNGTSWVLFSANDKTETLTNKTISGASNTLSAIPPNSLSSFAIASPLTNQIIQYNGTNWVNATSAGGGSGGGFSAGGSITKSGDGSTTTITIAHGLATVPDVYFVFPLNEAARGSYTLSVDSTNIIITYPIAPAEGSNNLSYVWTAGYVSAAVVALSAVSTTTLTNKSIGDLLTFVKQSPVPIDQSNAETTILYNKEIDSNNNTLAFKAQIRGSIAEVELTPKKAQTWCIIKDGTNVKAYNSRTAAYFSDTNFDNVLTSIINSITPAGTPTSIEIGEGDFPVAATMTMTSALAPGNITIKGQGAGVTNLILQTSITGTGRGFDIAGALGGTRLLTVNATVGKNSVTVSTADAAGFAVEDYVLLKSTVKWDVTNGAANQGEIHKVTAVNTGTGVVTFNEPLFDNYTTANGSNIAKATMLQNITLEDLTVRTISSGYTATGSLLSFFLIDNLQLRNVEMRDSVGESSSGIRIHSIINSNLDVICTRTTAYPYHALPAVGQYGIYCTGACQHIKVNVTGRGTFRHVFTIGGSTGLSGSGIPRDISVSGKSEMSKNMAFDTHHDGEGIMFVNCSIMGATHDDDPTYIAGLIQVRTKNNLIVGCQARQGVKGVLVSSGSANTTITGCLFHKVRSFTDNTEGEAIAIKSGVEGTVISGNTIVDCPGLNSILCEGANTGTVITGNNIRNCKPMKFVNSTDVVINGNRINNGSDAAMIMTGTSDWFVITGNSARSSATSTFVGANNVKANNTNL